MSTDILFGDEHVRRYRETGGEEGYEWQGTTCLLLTTVGRKTGEPRTLPLIFQDDDGRAVVVASRGGAPQHPAWYLNLRANPEVELQIKADDFSAIARDAGGEERERLWKVMTSVWPAYDDYQAKTDRQIPVVVIERQS